MLYCPVTFDRSGNVKSCLNQAVHPSRTGLVGQVMVGICVIKVRVVKKIGLSAGICAFIVVMCYT